MARALAEIGELRHRVVLQREVQGAADGGGGYPLTWEDVKTVWARVEPISGRELVESMALQGSVTHRIAIRYRPDIAPTPAWRIQWGARLFNVRSVIDIDEGRRFWQLVCEEGVAT